MTKGYPMIHELLLFHRQSLTLLQHRHGDFWFPTPRHKCVVPGFGDRWSYFNFRGFNLLWHKGRVKQDAKHEVLCEKATNVPSEPPRQ